MENNKTKNCIHCGSKISIDANKCSNCGEWVSGNSILGGIIMIILAIIVFCIDFHGILKGSLILIIILIIVFAIIGKKEKYSKSSFYKSYNHLIFTLTNDIKWLFGVVILGIIGVFISYYNSQLAETQKEISRLSLLNDKKVIFDIEAPSLGDDKKYFIYDGSQENVILKITNRSDTSITLSTESTSEEHDIFCNVLGKHKEISIANSIKEETLLTEGDSVNIVFDMKNIDLDYDGNLFFDIKCKFGENSNFIGKDPFVDGGNLKIEYRNIILKDSKILLINSTGEAIKSRITNFRNELQENNNLLKLMASNKSDLSEFNQFSIDDNLLILYKKENEGEGVRYIYNNIKEIFKENNFSGYISKEISDNLFNRLYFLGDCRKNNIKCNPYLSYDNLLMDFNYFSPILSTLEGNDEIDYIIFLPLK